MHGFLNLLAVLLGCAGVVQAAEDPSVALRVMTYNLRFASPNPPNAWPERRPLVKACVLEADPDLIGTQEGVYQQLKDVADDLPQYEWIGLGRDGGSRGEFMAIFYRRSRFEPLEYDHFWLSDTPDVIASSTWGNANRRMVTWVRFLDRATRRQFIHMNTHLDHAIQEAREKGARLIVHRVAALQTELPVVLTGDFNAESGRNEAYRILIEDGGFKDTWALAATRDGEGLGTFNGFRDVPKDGVRIDWILLRGTAEVSRAAVIPWSRDGRFPSDHFPVTATFQWL